MKNRSSFLLHINIYIKTLNNKVIAERYTFHNRKQQVGESVYVYISEINSLAADCSFKTYFDQALRDRLVSGLLNTTMVSRLI